MSDAVIALNRADSGACLGDRGENSLLRVHRNAHWVEAGCGLVCCWIGAGQFAAASFTHKESLDIRGAVESGDALQAFGQASFQKRPGMASELSLGELLAMALDGTIRQQ